MSTAVGPAGPTIYDSFAELTRQADLWAELGFPISDAILQGLRRVLARLSPAEPTRECVPVRARGSGGDASRGRTPLTVAEGIALVTVHPETLEKNHCFSLGGSRKDDRRVPALWISKGAPHPGWCFAGAPHSWLGLASAGSRLVA